MQEQIKVFEHDDFGRLDMLMIGERPYFSAVECATMLGYRRPHDAVSRHCKGSVKHGVLTNGGEQEKLFINEGDVYRLMIRSKLPAAERFEAWVFDEVLPSIRKHGSYITSEVLERLLSDPELASTYFSMLKTERDKNAALEVRMEALEPIVSYYDRILQCPSPIPVSIIAKDYGMTAIAFNKLLHGFKIQYKIGRTWLLYHEHDDKGYTVSKTYHLAETESAIHTYWTQKGRKFIYDVLRHYGILPQAEREGVCSCRT